MWLQQLVKRLLCLWVDNMPQLCNCWVQWYLCWANHVRSCWKSLAEEKLRENLSKVLPGIWTSESPWGVLWQPPGFAKLSHGSGMFLLASSHGTWLREQQMLDAWNLQWGRTNFGIWHSRFFWPWGSPSPIPDFAAAPFLVPNLSADLWLLRYFQ